MSILVGGQMKHSKIPLSMNGRGRNNRYWLGNPNRLYLQFQNLILMEASLTNNINDLIHIHFRCKEFLTN